MIFKKKIDREQVIQVTENFGHELGALRGCAAQESRKILGMWIAPDLATKEQIQALE